jgi:hypothetical protein
MACSYFFPARSFDSVVVGEIASGSTLIWISAGLLECWA